MPKRDLYNNLKAYSTLAPDTRGGDANGAAIDLRGSDSAMIIVSVGTEGDTLGSGVTIAVELQHSDDGTTWADVSGKDVQGSDDATLVEYNNNNQIPAISQFGYVGYKRYLRAKWAPTGSQSTGTEGSVVVVLGNLSRRPSQ